MKRFIKNPIILSLVLVLAGTLSAGTLHGQLQPKEENSATDTSPYGYQEMVFNDGTGQFEGWTLEKDNNLFIYTHSIPASDGNIGLLAWALSHGSRSTDNLVNEKRPKITIATKTRAVVTGFFTAVAYKLIMFVSYFSISTSIPLFRRL